jgi:hypothetical protein
MKGREPDPGLLGLSINLDSKPFRKAVEFLADQPALVVVTLDS